MNLLNQSKNKGHTVQELFNDYKVNICSYCVNKKSEDCDILIKGNITVACKNYKKCK